MSNTSSLKTEIRFDIPNYNGIGIYSIICNETEQRYIGSSIHVMNRLKGHEKSFNNGTCNKKIGDLIRKQFTFRSEVIEKISDGITWYELYKIEANYIRKYNSIDSGLNIARTTACTYEEDVAYLVSSSNNKRAKSAVEYAKELIRKKSTQIYSHWAENKIAYRPASQERYNKKMYFATVKLNPENAADAGLVAKIEQRMKDKSISKQAAIKEMLDEAK